MVDPLYSKNHIRESLASKASAPDEDVLWLAGAPPDIQERLRAALPKRLVPAAVLVPLVERDEGMTVLLTQRATTLKDHAGRSAFPVAAPSRTIVDAWAAALREAHEEIGCRKVMWNSPAICPTTGSGRAFA